ncbi:MAG: HAMP domain-containing histidine kinase [Clostridia bacterium]|nr:HAMP domain-containing histidine kinase [Clostridia bacterium]
MKRNNKSVLRAEKSVLHITLRSFIIKNLVTATTIFAVYITVFLLMLRFPAVNLFVRRVYFGVIADFLGIFMNDTAIEFIYEHSLCLYFICLFIGFTAICIIQSVSTLRSFDKTYRSLDAFTDTEESIETFPRSHSSIEIRLKDIKFEVAESRSRAAEAESKKDDLVMYLAHDLKTPLTSVIGYLTLLDESPDLPMEQKAKFTGIALDKAYRLEQLINEFFEITRFNIHSVTLERNRIDIGILLNQLAEEFYPMYSEKNLRLNIDLKEKILTFADADKLARIFGNLIKNAIAYSYSDSDILIGARVTEGNIVISFRNHCDPIPADRLGRLFEKFYRADSARMSASGGSGLGLAIAKQLTELHKGTIKAESNDAYTEFTVTLPYIPCPEITCAEGHSDT